MLKLEIQVTDILIINVSDNVSDILMNKTVYEEHRDSFMVKLNALEYNSAVNTALDAR